MRLAKRDNAQDTGQVFWSTVDTAMGEATSASFPIYHDGRWHDYAIDLTACPSWKGMMVQLRIDPGSVDAAEIAVDEVAFRRR